MIRHRTVLLTPLLLVALLLAACSNGAGDANATPDSAATTSESSGPTSDNAVLGNEATVATPAPNVESTTASDEPAAPTTLPTTEATTPTQTLGPEAGRISFMGPINQQGTFQVFVGNSDGTGLRQPSTGFVESYFPTLSPDGSRIAFTAPSPEGDVEIYVADVESGEATNLTNQVGQDQQPLWSPDGNSIAFVSVREGGDTDIWLMGADGSEPRRLARLPGTELLGSWSPDGSEIVYAAQSELGQTLFIVNVESGESRPLTEGVGRNDGAPAWNPNGELIVFYSSPDGVAPPSLYTIRPDGSEETQLTNSGLPSVFPTWSPDGRRLAYTEVQLSGEWRLLARELESETTYGFTDVTGAITSWRDAPPLADAGLTQGPKTSGIEVDPAVLEAAYKKGDPNAPVKFIEFSDYQCPFCQRWYTDTLPQLEPYIEDGTVQLIFIDLPLANHPQAPAAAVAARCAGELGGDDGYWAMHNALFEGLSRWSGNETPAPIFAELATGIGVDGAALQRCVEEDRYGAEVRAGLQEATRLGIGSTPSFVVNGNLVVGALPIDSFTPYFPQ
ncbi:MAG: thioredoxin domain-containing protein [Anaerolineales bacterium]|nr:thioredoxin domain-containing protein [Anaerolineales bacterium]MCB9128110.1 thioredoxin domain-containing protein [Ardenticatenales bacterium]MCB9171823.1 thioredoxin domain-containing protein [Ardenticatenales bacterium]